MRYVLGFVCVLASPSMQEGAAGEGVSTLIVWTVILHVCVV
jgi:hypothetical protein